MKAYLTLCLFFLAVAFTTTAQNWKLIPKSGTLWLELDLGNPNQKTLGQVAYTTASSFGRDSLFTFRDKLGPQWQDNGSGFININSYAWRRHSSIVGDSILQTLDNQAAFRIFQTKIRIALNAEPGGDTINGYLPPFHKATIQLPDGTIDSVKSYNIQGFGLIRVTKSHGLIHVRDFKLHHNQNFPRRQIDYTDRTGYREIVYRYETSFVTGSTIMDRHVFLKPKFIRNNYLVFPYRDSTVSLICSFGNCNLSTTVSNLEDTLALEKAFTDVKVDYLIYDRTNLSQNGGYFSQFKLDSIPSIRRHYMIQTDHIVPNSWHDTLWYANPPHFGPIWNWNRLCSVQSSSLDYRISLIYYVDTLGNATGTRPILVSLDQNQTGSPISIYPNPATDQVHVAVSKPTSLEVINALGVTIRRLELTESTTIEQLQTGFYLFKLTQDGQSQVKRVVVK